MFIFHGITIERGRKSQKKYYIKKWDGPYQGEKVFKSRHFGHCSGVLFKMKFKKDEREVIWAFKMSDRKKLPRLKLMETM